MPYLDFNNIGFKALACAVPNNAQSLDDLPAANAATIKSFIKHTGVRQRHISVCKQTALDLGVAAAKRALAKAKIRANDLDALIFMTQTPDFNAGTGNAFLTHAILELREDCLAFDIPLACSSFPYGLSVASALLQQPNVHRLLLISGDTQWHFYDKGIPVVSPDGRFMFGEAATALVLEKDPGAPAIAAALFTDGSGYKYLYNPLGGCRNAWKQPKQIQLPNGDVFAPAGKFGYMDGIEITSFSTSKVVEAIRQFLARQNKTIESFDGLVLHQANRQIVQTIARRLKSDPAKTPMSMDRYGNTSGASVSVTMVDAYADDRREWLDLLISAFGTGLSWGIVDIKLRPEIIEPIFTTDYRFDEAVIPDSCDTD